MALNKYWTVRSVFIHATTGSVLASWNNYRTWHASEWTCNKYIPMRSLWWSTVWWGKLLIEVLFIFPQSVGEEITAKYSLGWLITRLTAPVCTEINFTDFSQTLGLTESSTSCSRSVEIQNNPIFPLTLQSTTVSFPFVLCAESELRKW